MWFPVPFGPGLTTSLFFFLSLFPSPPLSNYSTSLPLPLPPSSGKVLVSEIAVKKLLWDFRTIPKKLLTEFLSEIKLLRFYFVSSPFPFPSPCSFLSCSPFPSPLPPLPAPFPPLPLPLCLLLPVPLLPVILVTNHPFPLSLEAN